MWLWDTPPRWICTIYKLPHRVLHGHTTKRSTERLDSFLAAARWLCAYFELTCLAGARYTCFEESSGSSTLIFKYLHRPDIQFPRFILPIHKISIQYLKIFFSHEINADDEKQCENFTTYIFAFSIMYWGFRLTNRHIVFFNSFNSFYR